MSNNTALSAKVRARNGANTLALRLAPAIFAAMQPFIGQNIYTVQGEFTQKFRKALPALPPLSYWRGGGYSLSVIFRTCENTERGAHYGEASVYVADIKDGVLASFYSFAPENFRTDYTPEAITAARETVRAARAALSTAESALNGFGEHDNG